MDRKKKLRIYNTLLAASGGVVLCAIWLYAYYMGLLAIPTKTLALIFCFFWLINAGFIAVVSSKLSTYFKDPSVSLPQMYWAGCTSFVTLIAIPSLTLQIYLLIVLILVFGIFKIKVRDFYRVATFFWLMIIMSYAISAQRIEFLNEIPITHKPDNGLFSIFIMGFCIFVIALLCNSIVALKDNLRRRNKELNQALEVKSQFLANMSHELRTPMNGVIGMLDIIDRKQSLTDLKQHVHIAKSSAKTLLVLVDEILDYSKLEAQKIDIEAIDIETQDLLHTVLSAFYTQFHKKGVELRCELKNSIPKTIQGDPFRIQQVLNNLVSNALKFTHKGHVIIECQWLSHQRCLEFSVSDTGVGIAPEMLKHIFMAFSQADISTTRKHGGTGLGLAISDQLCQLMGCKIHVKSTLNQGSQFSFSLPTKTSSQDFISSLSISTYLENLCLENIKHADSSMDDHQVNSAQDPACLSAMGSTATTSRQSKDHALEAISPHILLVDDNLTNLEVCSILLEDLAFSVTAIDSGSEALSRYYDNHSAFDAILLDCQMPDMDGYDVCAHIRQFEIARDLKAIPIIALTANALAGDREKCINAGMNDYLTKPIDTDKLSACLNDYTQGTKQSDVTQTAAPIASVENKTSIQIIEAKESQKNQIDSIQEQEQENIPIWDCLLYTSPSPRDKRQSRMPSSA